MRFPGKVGWKFLSVLWPLTALVVATCGPAAAPTATPAARATPTSAPAPVATPAPSPTATPAARATPTSTPAPVATPTPLPAATPTATAKFGGIYRTGTQGDPRQLYPLKYNMGVDIVRLQGVMNGLIQWNPYNPKTKELLPYLAESWSMSQDGLAFTFKLRQGVKWHDGRPLIMKDVLYSMDQLLQGHLKAQFAKVGKVEAIDDTTLRITLKALDPDFLVKFSQGHVMITPSHLTEAEFRNQPIGTGPFKWAKFTKDVSLELARNVDYFKKPLPYLDGAKIFTMPDPTVSRSAFQTGQLERTDNSTFPLRNPKAMEDMRRLIPGVQIYQFVSGFHVIFFNQTPPWTDQRVRTAFHLSINRDRFNEVFNEGIGYPWAGTWFAPAVGGQTGLPEEEMKTKPGYRQPKDQDWAESRRLLREAGIDGSKLVINFRTRHPYDEGPIMISEDLAKGGFTGKFNFSAADSATQQRELPEGKFDVAQDGFGPLVDLPEAYIPDFFMLGGLKNYGKWDNPEINGLYARQLSILDPVQRRNIVQEIYRKAIDWAVAPALPNNIRAVAEQPYVRNFPVGFAGFFDEWNRFERVWLDK